MLFYLHPKRLASLLVVALTLILSTVYAYNPLNKTIENDPFPQKIVSLNLCADQLLMEILPPERLVGITHLSLDPGISYHYEKAKIYQQHRGRIEEIIALKPDLIVAGQFTSQATNQLLEKLGYTVLTIGLPNTATEITEQLLMLGRRVGATQEAKKIVNDMQLSLSQLSSHRAVHHPRAAIYYANGFTAGKNTIVDEAMRLAGLKNIASEQGIDDIAALPLETLLNTNPEVFILGRYQENTQSIAHQILQHRALKNYIHSTQAKVIDMPDRFWNCAGPALVTAVNHLQAAYQQERIRIVKH